MKLLTLAISILACLSAALIGSAATNISMGKVISPYAILSFTGSVKTMKPAAGGEVEGLS